MKVNHLFCYTVNDGSEGRESARVVNAVLTTITPRERFAEYVAMSTARFTPSAARLKIIAILKMLNKPHDPSHGFAAHI